MAELYTNEELDRALDDSLSTFESLACSDFQLKTEQRDAIKHLALNKDVLAVLPTGFGKSMIFRCLVRLKQLLLKKHCCVVVVCPLRSIVEDQVVEAQELGLKATSMSGVAVEDLEGFELIFGSAEEVLASDFLSALRESESTLKVAIEAVLVDESHTVETWTGERYVIEYIFQSYILKIYASHFNRWSIYNIHYIHILIMLQFQLLFQNICKFLSLCDNNLI